MRERLNRDGTPVDASFVKKIEEAQEDQEYEIDGKVYGRIRYGDQRERLADWVAKTQAVCHDCLVRPGELHVPGCDWELCPKCLGQAISCGCDGDDDEEVE